MKEVPGESPVNTPVMSYTAPGSAGSARPLVAIELGEPRPQVWLLQPVRTAAELWEYRDLVQQLVVRDMRIRYKQAVMGFGWALLMPALVVLSGWVVRYAMAHLSGAELDAAALGSIAVKSLPWAFFVGAIGFSNTSLIGNSNLVTKIYFPREALPLASVIAQAFDSLIAGVVLLMILPFVGAEFQGALLWVPVLILLLFSMTCAVALFLSAANLFFRDVKYIVQVLLTFGIFFTPVFYEPNMLGELGSKLMMLNPLASILEGLRLCVINGHDLTAVLVDPSGVTVWTPWYLAYGAGWAIFGLLGATVFFHRLEFLFAEYA